MSRNIDLAKATIGSPTACSIALTDLIRTMERLDELMSNGKEPSPEEDRLIDKLEKRQDSLERFIRREIAEKLHIDAAILQEAVTFV
jgi:hypothetical protein